MSISKQYLKTKPLCKVTFTFAGHQFPQAQTVALAGDFNNWDPQAVLMKKTKTGEFTASLNLDKEKQYQFRYVVDGQTWLNDDEADAYAPTQVSYEQNSVVQL